MDTRRIPYYYALFLLCTHVGADIVSPPKNATLLCHNMSNTLSWEHDEAGPGLSFEVVVRSRQSVPVTLVVKWPDMSIDLSEYSNPTDDYFVKVFAVKDGNLTNKSKPTASLSYSYFQDSLAKIECSLDLPMVTVETKENQLQFSFIHPGVLYLLQGTTRKRRNYESQNTLPEFEYHIEIEGQDVTHDFSCTERECMDTLPVESSEKSYCLNINGEMKRMSVQGTRKYCSEPLKAAGINPIGIIIPIVLVCIGLGIIGVMVFVRKTRPSTFRPTALDGFTASRPQENPAPSEYSRISLGGSSPDPLTPQEQDTLNNGITVTDELRLPLGVPEAENENEPEQEAGERGPSEDGYTSGNRLERDEEEEQPSSYEPSGFEPSAYEPSGLEPSAYERR